METQSRSFVKKHLQEIKDLYMEEIAGGLEHYDKPGDRLAFCQEVIQTAERYEKNPTDEDEVVLLFVFVTWLKPSKDWESLQLLEEARECLNVDLPSRYEHRPNWLQDAVRKWADCVNQQALKISAQGPPPGALFIIPTGSGKGPKVKGKKKKSLKTLGTPWTTEQIDEEINRLLETARNEVLQVKQANHWIHLHTDWNRERPVLSFEICFWDDQAKEEAKKMVKKTVKAAKPSRAFMVYEGNLRNPQFPEHVKAEVLVVIYTDAYRKRIAMQKIIKKVSDDSVSFKDPEFQEVDRREVIDNFFGGCKFMK